MEISYEFRYQFCIQETKLNNIRKEKFYQLWGITNWTIVEQKMGQGDPKCLA